MMSKFASCSLVLAAFAGLLCLLGPTATNPAAAASAATAPPAPPPMIVAAWNYKPDASVSPVKGILRAGFRYRCPPGPWDWSAVYIAFTVDGKDVTDARAAARLREVPVMDWVTVYWWKSFHDKPPRDFCDESIATTKRLVADVRERLMRCGMTAEQLADVNHVLDFECWEQRQVPGATMAKEAPYGVTACYLFTEALNACGWKPSERGGAANYNTNHGGKLIPLGGPPHNRMTPYPIPGSLDGRTTFISGYLEGGPRGCMTEAEMLDVIQKAPAPLWLALEDNNPGLVRILRAAKASGKVRLVLLWGNGEPNEKTGDTGDRHRDRSKGGSKAWMKQQDERIARAIAD